MWSASKNLNPNGTDKLGEPLTGKWPEGASTFPTKNWAIVAGAFIGYPGFLISKGTGAHQFRIAEVRPNAYFGQVRNNPIKGGFIYKLDSDRNIVKSYKIKDFFSYQLWHKVQVLEWPHFIDQLCWYTDNLCKKLLPNSSPDTSLTEPDTSLTEPKKEKPIWHPTPGADSGHVTGRKTLWHSSPVDIQGEYILPRVWPGSGGDFVFASNTKYLSMLFMGRLTFPEHLLFIYNPDKGNPDKGNTEKKDSVENERWVLVELEPGLFEREYVNKPGWVYSVSAEGFVDDERLSMKDAEFINPNPVKILKRTFVPNIWAALQETPACLIPYQALFDLHITAHPTQALLI